jgi:hypothetical protein
MVPGGPVQRQGAQQQVPGEGRLAVGTRAAPGGDLLPDPGSQPRRGVVQRGAQRGGLGRVHVRIAALLACPSVHFGEVGLFGGAPRLRRRRQPGGGQVNAGHGAGVGAGEPGGDARPQVTAVRDVARIPQALAHEPMPQPGDCIRGQPPRRNWAGEAEPGQRRRHHRERVIRIAAVRAGVGEQRHDVQVLAERAGPAVGEQQR